MNKLFGILVLLLGVGISAAQMPRMSNDDQGRFNSFYSRWLQDKQTNDRDDMLSMERGMQDLMAKYQVPSNTPYEVVASQTGYEGADRRDRDRDRDHDRGYAASWISRMSPEDQREFNKHYQKWQEATAKNHGHDIEEHARKMEEIMARYNIPPRTPLEQVASNGSPRHYDARDFQGKLSPEDQKKFDKEYEHWVDDRRKGDQHEMAEHEGKMQEIMARYNIPRDAPYDEVASSGRGY